jgi:hypothetical protein
MPAVPFCSLGADDKDKGFHVVVNVGVDVGLHAVAASVGDARSVAKMADDRSIVKSNGP